MDRMNAEKLLAETYSMRAKALKSGNASKVRFCDALIASLKKALAQ